MKQHFFFRRTAMWALTLLACGAVSVSAQYNAPGNVPPADWIEFKDTAEGFKAFFPTRPQEKVDKFTLGKGGASLTRHFYAASGRDATKGETYMVGSVTLPVAAPANGTAVITRAVYEKLMAKLKDSFENSMQAGGESGCYLGSPQDVFAGAHRGREYQLEGRTCPKASVRMYATARRFFVVATVGATDNAFLRAFSILDGGERLIIE